MVHRIGYGEESGTGYLIWVIFRAAWAQQILFSPGRIPDFVSFMLAGIDKYTSLSGLGSYWLAVQSRCLPMWKNSCRFPRCRISQEECYRIWSGACLASFMVDATVPSRNDVTTQYRDREEVSSLFASIALMVLLNVTVYWLRSWSWSVNVL